MTTSTPRHDPAPSSEPTGDSAPPGSDERARFLPLAAIGALVLHLLFTRLLAHFLPREEFGAVVASQIFLFAASMPAFALQAASAAFAFAQRGVGKPVSPVASFDRIASRVAAIAFVLALVGYFAPLPRYFQLPSRSFGAAAPLLAATALLEAIATGTLLGARCERSFATAVVASPLLRLAGTLLFFELGFGTFSPVFAILVGGTVVAGLARARLGTSIAATEPDPESARRGRMRSPFAVFRSARTIATLFGFGILVHLDTLIVRTRLSAADAGGYAALAVIGRIGLLMTLPIALRLVIRVRRALIEKRSTFPHVLNAFLTTAAVHGALLALAHLAPNVPIDVFLDSTIYADVAPALSRYLLGMFVFGIAQVLIFYGIAVDRMPLYLLPVGCIPLAVILFVEKGDRFGNCVTVAVAQSILFTSVLAVLTLALAVVLPWTLRKLMTKRPSSRDARR